MLWAFVKFQELHNTIPVAGMSLSDFTPFQCQFSAETLQSTTRVIPEQTNSHACHLQLYFPSCSSTQMSSPSLSASLPIPMPPLINVIIAILLSRFYVVLMLHS